LGKVNGGVGPKMRSKTGRSVRAPLSSSCRRRANTRMIKQIRSAQIQSPPSYVKAFHD
jgi:hypothetical protein